MRFVAAHRLFRYSQVSYHSQKMLSKAQEGSFYSFLHHFYTINGGEGAVGPYLHFTLFNEFGWWSPEWADFCGLRAKPRHTSKFSIKTNMISAVISAVSFSHILVVASSCLCLLQFSWQSKQLWNLSSTLLSSSVDSGLWLWWLMHCKATRAWSSPDWIISTKY